MQVSNSSVARPWKLEQNTPRGRLRGRLRRRPRGPQGHGNWSKKMWQKKGPFFLSSNRNKKQVLKNLACPVQDSSRSCAGEISFNLKQTFQQICHSKGAKTGPQGDHFWFQGGPLSDPFLKHVSFARGSKTGPSTGWIWYLLGGPVLSPLKHLLHTNQHQVGNKGLEQGRSHLRLQKSYQLQVPKTNPRLAPCTCLPWSLQSFLFCFVDERGPVS